MDLLHTDAVILYAVLKLTAEKRARRRRQRSCWTKPWLLDRGSASYMPMLMEIRENNPEVYCNFLRMDEATFQELLLLVKPYIQRQDTKFCMSILAEERLVATLRYLATGRSIEDLKFFGAYMW